MRAHIMPLKLPFFSHSCFSKVPLVKYRGCLTSGDSYSYTQYERNTGSKVNAEQQINGE